MIFRIITTVLFSAASFAPQVYFFNKYDAGDGLVQNFISTINQDYLGRMWIGTAEGFSIYDGNEFVNYDKKEGVRFPFVNCFSPVNESINLVGSNGGGVLVFFKPLFKPDTLIKIYNTKEYLINNRVNNILQDWEGNYWFCTDSGVTRWSLDKTIRGEIKVKHFGPDEGFFAGETYGSVDSTNKLIWFGVGQYVYYFAENVFNKISVPAGSPGYPRVPFSSSDGKLYISFTNSALLYQNNSITDLGRKFNLQIQQYRPHFEKNDGTIWWGAAEGLWYYDGKSFKSIKQENGLEDDYVTAFYIDKQQNHWVGTGYGLYKFSDKSFQLIGGSEKIQQVGAFTQSPDGNIYCSSRTGIYKIENQRVIKIQNLNPVSGGIRSLEYINKKIWVATSGDIYSYNFNNIKSYFSKYPSPDNGLFLLCKSNDENPIVVNYRNLLVKIDGDNFSLLRDSSEGPNIYHPMAMIQDKNGAVWIGTHGKGLFFVKNKVVKKFTKEEGLLDESIRALYEDSKGTVWIGTRYEGLFKYSNGRFQQFSVEQGISSVLVQSIVEDKLGNIWIGTNRGVNKYDGKIWHKFDEAHGIKAGTIFSAFADNNKKLYFGTENGIYTFDPSLKKPDSPFTVHLKKFSSIEGKDIIDEHLLPFEESMLFGKNIPRLVEQRSQLINLPYSSNSMVFEFVSSDLVNEQKVKYSYFLDGFDSRWSQYSERNYINYTHLPAGQYRFKVKALNYAGEESINTAQLIFIIEPPFWQRAWFIILVVVLFILAVSFINYLIYQYKIRQALKLEKIRTNISSDLHDEIGTSLSSIAIFSELIKGEASGKNQKTNSMLESIERTSRSLIDKMGDIVWAINPDNDKLEDAILKLKDYAVRLLESRGASVHLNIPGDAYKIVLPMDVRRNLLMIFKEIVTNAAKYSEAKNITISFSSIIINGINNFVLEVKDDGIGFDINASSNGNGLKNIYRRAEEINGNLSLISAPGLGTNCRLEIPLK